MSKFSSVVFGAVGCVFALKKPLAKALLLPFILLTCLEVVSSFDPAVPLAIVLAILSVLVQTLFAITTHRMILLGPGSVPEWGIVSWTKRETLFTLYVLGIALAMIPFVVLVYIPSVGFFLAVIVGAWVMARLSLVFPGIAVDQGVTFGSSWALTKDDQILMLFAVIIFPIVLAVVLVGIPVLLLGLIPGMINLNGILTSFTTIFVVAALSIAYKVIYEEKYGRMGEPEGDGAI